MKKRWLYITLLIPFIIGFIVGSFKDFEIAKAVFIGTDFSTNPFGTLMSAFAPMISYFFLAFCSGYFLYFAIKEKENKLHKIWYWFVVIATYAVAVYFTGHKIFSINAFYYPKYKIFGFIFCALILVPVVYFSFKVAKAKQNKLFLRAVVILFVVYAIALVPAIQIPKMILRRPRFRVLIAGTYEAYGVHFFNWWEPNNLWEILKDNFSYNIDFSEEFKSFPSAHTCEAAMVAVSFPYFCLLDERLRKHEHWICIGGLLFTMLMGYSRMTMGAHFLSDISGGALIMIILFIIGNEINLKYIIKSN